MLIVKLPFPAPELMPNKKHGKSWVSTYAEKTRQREESFLLTKQALNKTGPQEWPECIPLSLIFAMPDKRHRDLDNLLASAKAAIDGMAEALGVNDRRFKPILIDSVAGQNDASVIAAIGVRIESFVSLEDA